MTRTQPTKSEEIAILTEAASRLGANSYCGPWLTSILPFIEREIRSDSFVDYDPRKAWIGFHAI
jgi:hypothetical protein